MLCRLVSVLRTTYSSLTSSTSHPQLGPLYAHSSRLSLPFSALRTYRYQTALSAPCDAPRIMEAKMPTFKVHNTLKPGAPVEFVPIQKGHISWYACGPTVYDHAHLGHARNYVSTDIIRRILMHYFGYKVNFIMNITDVDDKIIIKARRQKLFDREVAKMVQTDELVTQATKAFLTYAKNNAPLLGDGLTAVNYIDRRDAAYGKVLAGGTLTGVGTAGDDEAKMKMHLNNLNTAAKALQNSDHGRQTRDVLLAATQEIFLPYLDSLYKETIDAQDHTIFTDVTKFWEDDFFDDMTRLNVMTPDTITRVTEYVPQIVDFTTEIVDKGFAYESDGSIYFDIAAFERAGNLYARLRPESRNDKALQEDGEGALSKGTGGKRAAGDFALWKKSKAGEPSWPSPWGEGRPGWHIECSVMASDVLGAQMDIHSGGIDLAFPHHDNELAQSEAYHCTHGHEHKWVNYFLHMGHLSIAGSKMSKSLKNFQTIKEALGADYTPRSMRVVFLMGRWNDGVEISLDMRMQAESWETTINNFFANTKSLIADAAANGLTPTPKLAELSLEDESSLSTALVKAKADLHAALLDSFDTPRAMNAMYALVRDANIYISSRKEAADLIQIEMAARWITHIVGCFGLDADASAPYEGLGWAPSEDELITAPEKAITPYVAALTKLKEDVTSLGLQSNMLDSLLTTDAHAAYSKLAEAHPATHPTTIDVLAYPYLRIISSIRDELRQLALALPEKKAAILALSDRIRDDDAVELGVQLDDRVDSSGQQKASLIKFVPRSVLIAARQAKLAAAAEKEALKSAAAAKRRADEEAKDRKAAINPADLFRDNSSGGSNELGRSDDKGIPVTMADGSDVPKNKLKKLVKLWEAQKKAHDEWATRQGGGAAS